MLACTSSSYGNVSQKQRGSIFPFHAVVDYPCPCRACFKHPFRSFLDTTSHLHNRTRPGIANLFLGGRNRAISIRSKDRGSGSSTSATGRRGFSFASLRGAGHQELSRRLHRLIKSANNLVGAHETAGRERISIATQLSEWGEQTTDEAISDISDKVGVVLSELGEQEDTYAHALDESRTILKTIRNTEKSVQPSRDGKARIADDIARLKAKEPESARLVILEQELVRAEAENLVAEAQLTNIVSGHHLSSCTILLENESLSSSHYLII
jgi:hypothetical protein